MLYEVVVMEKTIDATFDGEVFRPDKPVDLEPNTNVNFHVDVTLCKPVVGRFSGKIRSNLCAEQKFLPHSGLLRAPHALSKR